MGDHSSPSLHRGGRMASQMLAGLTNAQSLQAEYPPATKHFLLIGFLGMFIGSVVFCFLSFKKQQNKMQETIMFLATAISAGCYYCMWSGFGVSKKLDSAGNTRMVFFAHFVDRFFSMPLVIYSLCQVANAEFGEIVFLLGLDMLMWLARPSGPRSSIPGSGFGGPSAARCCWCSRCSSGWCWSRPRRQTRRWRTACSC